jgi:hypothetical protein
MNDEVRANCLNFIVHRSDFILALETSRARRAYQRRQTVFQLVRFAKQRAPSLVKPPPKRIKKT